MRHSQARVAHPRATCISQSAIIPQDNNAHGQAGNRSPRERPTRHDTFRSNSEGVLQGAGPNSHHVTEGKRPKEAHTISALRCHKSDSAHLETRIPKHGTCNARTTTTVPPVSPL